MTPPPFTPCSTLSFHLEPARRPEPRPRGGRVPRLARLLALAIKFETLIRDGIIRDYAALARLGHVSRAWISQIMNLLLLAPDIQEEILFLPLTEHGRDPMPMHHVQPIALIPSWKMQRRLWRLAQAACGPSSHKAIS